MNTQGWKNVVRRIAVALLLLMPAGCLTVGDGGIHPFATMFLDKDAHPLPQQVFQTSCATSETQLTPVDLR